MRSGVRDLFPLGDIDESVVAGMAERYPLLPAADVAAALGLGRAVLEFLEELPGPIHAAGLSPARWRLLIALVAQAGPDGARIGELATHLGVKEPTVTATVDRAEADGHVERVRDDADARVVRVRITASGMQLVGRLVPEVSGRLSRFVAALGGAPAARRMADRLHTAVHTVVAADREES